MNRPGYARAILSVLLLFLMGMACNFPGRTLSKGDTDATQTAYAKETSLVETEQARAPTEQPTETPIPESIDTPTIAHALQPSEPGILSSRMTDLSSAPLAEEHRAIGDSFSINLYERPFTQEVMDYQSHLDIVFAELGVDDPWVYVIIRVEEAFPEGVVARYSVEIDLDIDGRGDWLITASLPASSEWTTDGVRVLEDTNEDVGGPNPLRVDEPDSERNGYDQLVFDSGVGSDPDAAWVRRDPEHENRVQLAFKHSIIDADIQFLWGAWSQADPPNAIWFDYHDRLPIEQAGEPASNSDFYPIKALASLDNTCRWAFGFTPAGDEPGLCDSTTVPTTGPDQGGYWVCTGGLAAPPVCECKSSCEAGDQPCTPCDFP
jgi:hypothetical protein